MESYDCYDTNEIVETSYDGIESGFCIVEQYEYAYKKELPRFKKHPFKAYGLPYNDKPIKQYRGIGLRIDGYLPSEIDDSLARSEKEAIELKRMLGSIQKLSQYELIWLKING